MTYCWWKKSQTTTWDVYNPINNGINYQPQLVSQISEPSACFLLFLPTGLVTLTPCPHHHSGLIPPQREVKPVENAQKSKRGIIFPKDSLGHFFFYKKKTLQTTIYHHLAVQPKKKCSNFHQHRSPNPKHATAGRARFFFSTFLIFRESSGALSVHSTIQAHHERSLFEPQKKNLVTFH